MKSDLHSCEVTLAVAKKTQKKIWGFNRILTHNLCDTSVMPYQLSYEAFLEAGQERV